ncbi:hypothetical protein IAT38_003963 [Cryptococcus sp. DSM 104549]
MGFLDLFSACCGPRKGKSPVSAPAPETSSLLPPRTREESIISSDGATGSYGATERLTDEQKLRIETIGREAGTYMLPIQSLPRHAYTSISRGSVTNPQSLSSASSSRPPSPSPVRGHATSPGALPHGEGEEKDDGVVRKQLFVGGGGMGLGTRKTSGGGGKRKKGKGKGKA